MRDYTSLVNIEVGTDSEYRESNGNTLPNVQWPFGNQSYVLQSNKADNGWFYKPKAHYTEGIRVSNQPSPWLGDYGQITMLPFVGDFNIDLHSSLTEKLLQPHMMSGNLNRYKTSFKLVPTNRGAKLAVENNSGMDSKLLIDCHIGVSDYQVSENVLLITNRNIPEGEYSENYRKYYAIEFDCNIDRVTCYKKDLIVEQSTTAEMQLVVELASDEYAISLASSYISLDYARGHVEQIANTELSELEQAAKNEWNKYLNTIEIDSDNPTFYSNMYRLFCYPRIISEPNQSGEQVYYNFKTQTIDSGVMISDVGFWDTYRTTMPLYKQIVPKMYKQIIDAILNYYQSYGWLPRWLAPYERGIMPSTLVDSVIATALVDGDISEDRVSIAFEALLKNANTISDKRLFGREFLQEYIAHGYVPSEVNGESVSVSLDNYYCDYAIFKALEKYGLAEAETYKERCQNYHLLFNRDTCLFESLSVNKQFDPDFNPNDWGYDFCESAAYQNNFNIVHDVPGMIDLFGGKNKLEKRLDEITTAQPEFNVGRYGFEIHEMTEYAKVRNLGHFAISNQPSFNIPFWYLHIGNETKFNQLIGETLKHFTNNFDGYPGDEDNGSMAAWYVLVCIGKYPFCPVDGMIDFESQFKYKINKI